MAGTSSPLVPARTVLVTGSSRGVGRSICDQLTERGDLVFGCSRSGENELVRKNYRHFVLDVCDEVAVRGMFAAIAATTPKLDLVINNAGVSTARLALVTSAAEFTEVVQSNLVGAFVVMREAIRMMKRVRFGRIVNFSSINVPLASVGASSYNASKAGLEKLGETLSRECATDDITINCIGLSLVAGSGMVEELSVGALVAKQQALTKASLLEIDEIIHAIDFFAAPVARNITGQTVYFGGIS
jgi:3-oxoacyl-[acyl-carrier protein] reductase